MQLFKFYGLVFREAFRHSLDITEGVIFVAIAFGGFVAAQNPGMTVAMLSQRYGHHHPDYLSGAKRAFGRLRKRREAVAERNQISG